MSCRFIHSAVNSGYKTELECNNTKNKINWHFREGCVVIVAITNLDSCTNDNAGEEVASNDTRDSHHQALDARQGCEEREDEIGVVAKPRVQLHHEVHNGAGRQCNEEQVWN